MTIQESVVHLQLENEKARTVPHVVVPPLIVSCESPLHAPKFVESLITNIKSSYLINAPGTAPRGVACVLAARKRALVYILEEDEELSDEE